MLPRKSEQRRNCWGYSFGWTPEHLTKAQLQPLIFSYDTLATKCLDRLDQLSPQPVRLGAKKASSASAAPGAPEGEAQKRPDLYELLKRHAGEDESLQQLWQEVSSIPEWVDWDQIERGQKVFYRYGGPMVISLAFQSLLGGMGSRRIVETLVRTGGFGVKVARRRLLETLQYLLKVTHDVDSMKPGGDGFASSLRVRFLHASVRRRIMQLAKRKPEYYDVEEYGVPINDLDSIATIVSFSSAIIWLGFPRQGIFLRQEEIADYIALWRWIAHVLGAPTDPFSTPARAKVYMESIISTEIEPTETSQTLANNIIACLQDQPPAYASRPFLQAQARWLNGPILSDALGVPRPPLYYTALVAGQCLFLMAVCYIRRSVAAWDAAGIRRARRLLRRAAVDLIGGRVATHEFRFVPDLGLTTTREGDPGEGVSVKKAGMGVEQRNLRALMAGAAFVAMLAWLGMMSVSGMLQKT